VPDISIFNVSEKVHSTVESLIADDTISKAISLKKKMDNIVKKNVRKQQDWRQRVENPF